MRFARRTAELLNPGGIAGHTTELELTDRAETADWGHLACYRPDDLRELASAGFEMELNFHIAMETPEDRWVSAVLLHGPELAVEELSHWKVAFQRRSSPHSGPSSAARQGEPGQVQASGRCAEGYSAPSARRHVV